jgi:GTP cyclohydrolase I
MKNKIDPDIGELFDFPNGELVRERVIASLPRIRKAYAELFSGYKLKAEEVLNETIRTIDYSGVVRVGGINFYTFCEHHFLPFFGTADVCYQPGEIITGLGKIVRLVRDVHARRLQIQEIMTRNIAEDMERVLGARGVAVRTRAKHLCTCSRGPSDDTSFTEVTYATGSLADYQFPEVVDQNPSPNR